MQIRRNRIKTRKAPWLKPLPGAAVGLKVTPIAIQYGFCHLNIEVPAFSLRIGRRNDACHNPRIKQ